ncbi:MAG: hypothetical protein HZB53_21995 [Chloroflexi bacterium]|nr:hypothetical protein [Chloroflexota bacterium]
MKTIFRVLICLSLLNVVGCIVPGASPGYGLDVKLVMAKAPALNEPVVVTTTVTAGQDTRVSAHLDLFQARAEVLSGFTEGSFDLRKDIPAIFTTTLRFIEERGHLVVVDAYGTQGMHGAASVGVYVTRTGGTFDMPRPTPGPQMPLTSTPIR